MVRPFPLYSYISNTRFPIGLLSTHIFYSTRQPHWVSCHILFYNHLRNSNIGSASEKRKVQTIVSYLLTSFSSPGSWQSTVVRLFRHSNSKTWFLVSSVFNEITFYPLVLKVQLVKNILDLPYTSSTSLYTFKKSSTSQLLLSSSYLYNLFLLCQSPEERHPP